MADWQGGGDPPRRRPSYQGRLMLDVTRGALRARKWPRKRGTPRSPEQRANVEKFAAVQKAWNYADPDIQIWMRTATGPTPMLPRDMWTMMLYNRLFSFVLDGGKVAYPMPAKLDVEAALDAITQTPGEVLTKTENGWAGTVPAQGFQAALIYDRTLPAEGPAWAISGLADWTFLTIFFDDITASASGTRFMRVSVDGGASYISSGTRYTAYNTTGGRVGANEITYSGSAATAARSGIIQLGPNIAAPGIFFDCPNRPLVGMIDATLNPITNIELRNTAGNLTGGRIRIFAMR